MTLRERIAFALFCVLHRRSLAAQHRVQTRRLRRLVRYLYAHVPLVRARFDAAGITPKSIRTLDDIAKVPVFSKETFLGKPTEEYIDSSRLVNSRWYVTSGTSGTPFRFLMSEIGINDTYTDFATFRFLWWRGEPLNRLPKINIARIKIRSIPSAHRLFIPVNDYLSDPDAVIAKLAAFRTEIIYAYPSILLDLALRLESKSAQLPSLRYALSFGEMLTPSVRASVEQSLHCEVYDRYGLEEIGVVGVECAVHDGFHINSESVIVEITDDLYRPVAHGTEGHIVVTDLYNFGMPFIRYDSGDRGWMSVKACPCGLRSPRLWVSGRYSAYLTFPVRRIHHLEFDGAMDGFMHEVLRYQIAKKSDAEIHARIIPGPAFQSEVSQKIKESLQRLVGARISISVEIVDTLPITERGKSRIVIDESTHPAAR